MIVVDANVAAKWYLPELGSEAALELMDGASPLFAPDLIRLEVLAAITRCVRTGEA
jgi:predicted nucleic acid-binding protein